MHPKIMVVSLGPGDPELLTLEASNILKSGKYRIIFRTDRHPVCSWLHGQGIQTESLDSFYPQYDDFESMHQAMASWLWHEAFRKPICFGVREPETDGVVSALRLSAPDRSEITVLPGVNTFSQCTADLPGIFQTASGCQIVPAAAFQTAAYDPSLPLFLTEIDSKLLAGDIKLHLSDLCGDEMDIVFYPPSEKRRHPFRIIPLYQLDLQPKYDHTSAVFIPGTSFELRSRQTYHDLETLVSRLRSPEGCPWDRIQTHQSLRPYMIEEAWEAVNAIDEGDPDHLADELGDVLFQVMFHSSIAQSCGEFTITDVITDICRKMIQRHPHVFRSDGGKTADEISANWEKSKMDETGSRTIGETLDLVSPSLPSLKYATKVLKKLSQLPGFTPDSDKEAAKIREDCRHLFSGGSFSSQAAARILIRCAEICYLSGQDPELLLHQETDRLKECYKKAENMIVQDGKDPESLTFQELCVYFKSVGIEIE